MQIVVCEIVMPRNTGTLLPTKACVFVSILYFTRLLSSSDIPISYVSVTSFSATCQFMLPDKLHLLSVSTASLDGVKSYNYKPSIQL